MKPSLAILIVAAAALCGCVSSGASTAQEVHNDTPPLGSSSAVLLDDNASLDDYLKYALLNNPGVKAAFADWTAAVEAGAQADALPNPTLSYAYFIENVETRVGPQKQKLEISQMFPWFGKRGLKGDIAALSAKAAYESYEAAKLQLLYKVQNTYFEYYYLGRSISTTERNVKLMRDLEGVVRAKYKASSLPHAALLKLQVELGSLEDRLKSLRDLRTPMQAKLNAAMNRPVNSPVPWPKGLPSDADAPSEAEAEQLIQANNPELKALAHRAEGQAAAAKLSKKNYYPNLMLGAGIIDTGDSSMPNVQDSGKDAITAMVGISLPIWVGTYRAASREAKAREEAATHRIEEKTNTLRADLAIALYNYRDAGRKLRLYDDTLIPKARESFEVSTKAFESGSADFINVIDAQRVMLDFELGRERALTTRAQRLAELEMLTGRARVTADDKQITQESTTKEDKR